MILIACVDDNLGMAFHRRRQSQDRLLRARILERSAGRALWMSAYSARQFDSAGEKIRVDEDCLSKAGPGEFCLAELVSPSPWADRIEQVVLYRWNRSYPSDLRFDLSLEGWRLEARTEFPGFSHEQITEEIYTR